MSFLEGDSIGEWRKYAESLYEENLLHKEEREQVGGIIQGLRSQLAQKDKKLNECQKREQELKCKHEKQLARLKKKHDEEMSAVQTRLHSAEHEILLYQSLDDRVNYYEGKIAVLRGLNNAIMDKMKTLTIERDALQLIVAHSKIPDLTPEVCRLKAELKQAQILLSQMKLGEL